MPTQPFQHTLKTVLILLLFLTSIPVDSATITTEREKAHQLLKEGRHHAVTALASGEREILLGLLELERGNSKQAILILNSSSVKGDPVAAMIRAEAYRRESVQAAIRAGNYAHAVNDDISKLKQARLSAGIDEAEQRLSAFIELMDRAPVAIASATQPIAQTVPDNASEAVIEAESINETDGVDEAIENVADQKTNLIDSIEEAVESWRVDWESRDSDAYLSHYHPSFSNNKHDYNSWSAYKRRINRNKSYITVDITNLKITKALEEGPDGEGVVVTFRQKYRSNNFSGNSNKQLYLIRQNSEDEWKILSEGEAGSSTKRRIIQSETTTTVNIETGTASRSATKWAINIAAFDTLNNAEQMAESILISGDQQPFVSTVPLNGGEIHRVRIGMYPSKNEAVEAMLQICPQLDVDDCWLENLHRD